MAPDPWRLLARTQLRRDESSFGLALLGLPADPGATEREIVRRVAASLIDLLWRHPEHRWRLDWRRRATVPTPVPTTDVTIARYDPQLRLSDVSVLLDESDPLPGLDSGRRRALDAALIRVHTAVRDLPDIVRPRRLVQAALRAGGGDLLAARYIGRALAGTWLSPVPRSTVPPTVRRPDGLGALHFWVAHDGPQRTVDLWVQAQHVALDGAPVQELLGELRDCLRGPATGPAGIAGPVAGPLPVLADAVPACCSSPAAAVPVDVVTGVVDLGPALALRARLAPELPVAGLVAWLLDVREPFRGEVFCTPVDLPGGPGRQRTTRLAVIRPADHRSTGAGDCDLAAYQVAFLAELAAARADGNAFADSLRLAARLPPVLAGLAASLAPGRARRRAGSVGVTVLRDVDVFLAPINPVYRAYVALARITPPDAAGRRWAAVSVKAPADRLPAYRDAACAALGDPAGVAAGA